MGKRVIDSVIKEKIKFIDDNSHVLVNILNNRISDSNTVLETITEMVISNKSLSECTNIEELQRLIELNNGFYIPRLNDSVDSMGVIFCVTHYVNSCISTLPVREEIRDRLRLYTSSFRNSGTFSKEYNRFIKVENDSAKELKKK